MKLCKYSFNFEELEIDANSVASLMGYGNDVPKEMLQQIDDELNKLINVVGIEGGYVVHSAQLNKEQHSLGVKNLSFQVGCSVFHHYKDAEQLALFICTAGHTISSRAQELMNQGHLIEGYAVDIIGSIVVEKAMDKIHAFLKEDMSSKNLKCSNRYSPGYCDWNVSEQSLLFSFFPKEFCGVTLSDSCLMLPIKSVSGIIGIGKNVELTKYTCAACSSVNCLYRGKNT